MTGECATCKYAVWDYEVFYHPHELLWSITGCKLANDEENCTDYEEDDE